MAQFGFRTVFGRLFVSVFLTLLGFAAALVLWVQLVHNDSQTLRQRAIARQITGQLEPFLADIENQLKKNNRLQARFGLAVVKKSFDIFDETLNAKMGLYDKNGQLLLETDAGHLPKILPPSKHWLSELLPTLSGQSPKHILVSSELGYTLWYESRIQPKARGIFAMNLVSAALLLLGMMGFVLWAIAKNLTRRIDVMAQNLKLLGEGDFSVRIKEEGGDELTTLAHGFNQAAQKIQRLVNANNLLLAHASHEFRTPITRMRLQTEMLGMLGDDLPNGQKTLLTKRTNAINQDLTGLNDLIESILLVSRLDAGFAQEQAKHLDFLALVQDECQHYKELTLHGETLWVSGHASLLTHLVRNLINNAFVHGKAPVSVYVYGSQNSDDSHQIPPRLLGLDSPTKDKPALRLKKQKPNTARFAVLAVLDGGTGVPPEKRQDIFSPFVRLNQEKKGSGLGLSLVAQIVQMHGGTILTDTWQAQTRFLVVLPMQSP